jgi:hypothetical protein
MIWIVLLFVLLPLRASLFVMSFQVINQNRRMMLKNSGQVSSKSRFWTSIRRDPFLLMTSTSLVSLTTFPTGQTNQDQNEANDSVQEIDVTLFSDLTGFDEELERIVASDTSHHHNSRIASLLYGKQLSDVPHYANEAVQRAVLAEDLLHWMQQRQKKPPLDDNSKAAVNVIRPTAKSYNAVLRAWSTAISNLKNAPYQPHEPQIKTKHHDTTHLEKQEDSQSRAPQVLFTLNGSRSPAPQLMMTLTEARTHAVDLLKEMESNGIAPTVESYNTVMNCVVSSRLNVNIGSSSAADQVQQLFDSMTGKFGVRPNSETYQYVIDEWVHSPHDGPEKAERFLLDIEKQSLLSSEDLFQMPERRAYHSVLTGWASHYLDKCQGAQRAENLLMHMDSLSEPTLHPDAKCYFIVIDAWSKCGQEMPTKEAVKETATKANQLLQKLEKVQKSQGGGDKNEASIYVSAHNSVIKAWSHISGDKFSPYKAQKLLESLEKHYDSTGEIRYGPNIVTYTAAIMAWARSPLNNIKAECALKILKRMTDKYKETGDTDSFRPNLYTYNAVLNACATSKNLLSADQDKVTKIMFAVFKALEIHCAKTKQDYPSHITYSLLLKGVLNLMPLSESRDDIAHAVFKKCCRDGQVDVGVMRQLRLTASGELYQHILNNLEDGATSQSSSNKQHLHHNWQFVSDQEIMEILPKKWSHKVKITA